MPSSPDSGMLRRQALALAFLGMLALSASAATPGPEPRADTPARMPEAVTDTADAKKGAESPAVEAPPRNPKYFNAEREPLGGTARQETRPAAGGQATVLGAVQRMVFWLVLLAAVSLLALWGVRTFFPGGKKLFATPAAEVLGRTYLDSRRYLALVRVGRRVLVVGVDTDGMHPVGEITDADEVADILRQTAPSTSGSASFFQTLLQGRLQEPSRPEATRGTTAAGDADRLADVLSGLEEQIRQLRTRG